MTRSRRLRAARTADTRCKSGTAQKRSVSETKRALDELSVWNELDVLAEAGSFGDAADDIALRLAIADKNHWVVLLNRGLKNTTHEWRALRRSGLYAGLRARRFCVLPATAACEA